MINDAPNDVLSRSASQNDQSDQSLAYIKGQSSCSSLTSGIGQSDQSISNDRVSALDQDIVDLQSNQSFKSHRPSATSISDNDKTETATTQTTNNAPPQYLRLPQDKLTSSQDNNSLGDSSKLGLGAEANVPGTRNDHPTGLVSPDDSGIRIEELKANTKQFVDVIFTDSQSISLEKKAEFGRLMRTHEARLLFAQFVDDYRVNSKRVSELTFYSLAQYFSIILLECLLAEDFRPAKIIMNMMFTYYYEQNIDKIPPRERSLVLSQDQLANMKVNICNDDADTIGQDGQPKTVKTYLYNLLKDQEIFKSIRFWTSAFYESVIVERNNHPVFVDKQRGKLSNERRDEELDCSKNITFGLLGSFIHNMCLLDLSHEFCQEFLDKHSTIAGLSECQLEMLRSNLASMFKDTSDKAPISHSRAGERLSTFLHKLGTRLNQ